MVLYPNKCFKCGGTLNRVQDFDMRYTECLMCGRVEYSAVHKAKVLDFKALKGQRLNKQNGEPRKPKPPQ